MAGKVVITNIKAFQADLRASAAATPRELTAALRKAGVPLLARAKGYSPVRTGALRAGYKVSVSGTTGNIVSGVPYAGGAEWGVHRKWSGFAYLGPPGSRIAGKAVEEGADQLLEDVAAALRDVITVKGWAT